MKPLLALLFAPLSLLAADYPTLGHVERLDPALDALVAPDAKIEKLCEGFQWCEGPVWKDGALLFSDVPRNVIHQWNQGQTAATVFLQPSGMLTPTAGFREQGSNGLVLDEKGRLVICEHGERRLARLEADNKTQTAIVDRFEGKRFNSPNDAAVRKNGDIYFTDPPYGLEKLNDSPLKELKFNGVFHWSAAGGIKLAIKDLTFPNGIAFSPDEKTLYVAVSDPKKTVVMAYDVQPDGAVTHGREFIDGTALREKGAKGAYDGLKVDQAGNVFTSAPGGLQIVSSAGKPLGMIVTDDLVSNCAWGDDGSTLYLTSNHMICRIKTKTRGDKFQAGAK
jgi:gluconolactonase